MPVRETNVDPPDWQPSRSFAPMSNTSPTGDEPQLPEWTPRVNSFLVIRLLSSIKRCADELSFSIIFFKSFKSYCSESFVTTVALLLF